jgi:hypothetical protein
VTVRLGGTDVSEVSAASVLYLSIRLHGVTFQESVTSTLTSVTTNKSHKLKLVNKN